MSASLYTDYFGFSERPFTLLPDPDFLYWSKSHSRAFAVLEYGLTTSAPLTVITGEVGAGKTTLVQALLARMDSDITVGLISNAQGGRGDLLRWVLASLDIGLQPGADYVTMFEDFQTFVISEYAHGRRVVLIIDEAQNLTVEALEELRMLTNINSNKDELLQLILVGQPELREVIRRPELAQFAQRVSATYHLEAMNRTTTRDYISHRLRHVGGRGDEFTPPAVTMIHRESGGVPRLVNKLCDLALVYAAASETRRIGVGVLNEIIRDGLFLKSEPAPAPEPLYLVDPVFQSVSDAT